MENTPGDFVTHQEVPMSRLDEWATIQVCPQCGHQGLRIEWRLKAKGLTDFSLAGVQMKVSATEVPFVVCDCGLAKEGKR
jgi:hypothetical protein